MTYGLEHLHQPSNDHIYCAHQIKFLAFESLPPETVSVWIIGILKRVVRGYRAAVAFLSRLGNQFHYPPISPFSTEAFLHHHKQLDDGESCDRRLKPLDFQLSSAAIRVVQRTYEKPIRIKLISSNFTLKMGRETIKSIRQLLGLNSFE
ncbi:hypothetical protein CBL_10385 [Carabus blaptoides fortunei]